MYVMAFVFNVKNDVVVAGGAGGVLVSSCEAFVLRQPARPPTAYLEGQTQVYRRT